MPIENSTLLYIQLSLSNNIHNNIFEHIQNGVLITNPDSEVVYCNPSFTRITGYTREDIIGCNPGMLHSGRHDKKFYEAMWKDIQEKGYWEGEIWNRRKSGEIFPEFLTISTLFGTDETVCNYVAISSDISHFKNDIYHKLKFAFYDPLTELPNRVLYHDRVMHAINKGKTDPQLKHAILFMDLDQFKQVNDIYGHLIGDHLLKLVGQRLASVVRIDDTIARVGGDEFTAILTGIQDKAAVKKLAERMVSSIEKPFLIDGHEIHISISIGISFYPGDAHKIDDLLEDADKAMYDAKRTKQKIQFYESLK